MLLRKIVLFFIILISTLQVSAQIIPFAFITKQAPGDPCSGTPALGAICTGGAIYAGQFDSGKYMVTPGNCTNSGTPTCSGAADTLNKNWRGSSGSDVDIAGIENITAGVTPSSSSYRGHVTTPVITGDASISSDSAADFCNDMTYGTYSDWYLPSKSELAYIYCHATVGGHNTSNPPEDPNCTSYGGKTSELTGFATFSSYWSSTEVSAPSAWNVSFFNGTMSPVSKGSGYRVRCVRRY